MANVLPKDVAAKYTCVIEPTRVRLPRPFDVEVDLRTISVEQADDLVARGFDLLVPKPAQDTSEKADVGAGHHEPQDRIRPEAEMSQSEIDEAKRIVKAHLKTLKEELEAADPKTRRKRS